MGFREWLELAWRAMLLPALLWFEIPVLSCFSSPLFSCLFFFIVVFIFVFVVVGLFVFKGVLLSFINLKILYIFFIYTLLVLSDLWSLFSLLHGCVFSTFCIILLLVFCSILSCLWSLRHSFLTVLFSHAVLELQSMLSLVTDYWRVKVLLRVNRDNSVLGVWLLSFVLHCIV